MVRFKSFTGGQDAPKSDGQKFQCDCPDNTCGCGDWGYWIPAGQPIPNVVLCFQCQAGKHDDGSR